MIINCGLGNEQLKTRRDQLTLPSGTKFSMAQNYSLKQSGMLHYQSVYPKVKSVFEIFLLNFNFKS